MILRVVVAFAFFAGLLATHAEAASSFTDDVYLSTVPQADGTKVYIRTWRVGIRFTF